MSFRDRHGFQRVPTEVSGSHSSSHDQYDIERNGGEHFRISTPTRPENPVTYNDREPLQPRNIQSHSTFDTNTSMDYGGYHFVSQAQQMPDTSVLMSDEVISGSLTNGTRMS